MIEQTSQGDRANGARWRPLLALVPAGILLVLLLRPVWDVDIFWQLKLGELILEQAGPIRTEPFAARHLGEPLPAVAWAGQAVLAFARQIGGWDLVRVLDAVCWLGGFLAVSAACRWRGASAAGVALAIALACFAALPTASVRPQSFACLCFGLLLALHRLQLRPVLTIAIGAPLLVAWQNLHPSVSVGVIAMSLAALPGWIGWLRRRNEPPVAASALALLGLAAMFATPDGVSLLETSALNAEMSVLMGASEWRPLWIAANGKHALRITVVLLAALVLLRRYRRLNASELAVALGLLVMTVAAYRFVLFWAVAIVPVVSRCLRGDDEGHSRREALIAGSALLLVAIGTPVLAPTRFSASLPLAAVEHLRRFQVQGTVYGDFPFGGVLIDAGYPDWKVAYDGRYYRYSRKEWQYNGGIETGIVPLVDVVRKWNPAAFVLDSVHNRPLAEALSQSPAWRLTYASDGIVVYLPRLSRRESPGSAPH
ncbi:hypothetical protein AB3M93_17080 [Novosphingobium panipatense]|jgi:hypothetical protein|uniref:hypothetical protein n=1 Tax=Novosphingobium TaxID=165696 RepID=UPI000CDAE58E|nr:hypothetical protein [Novosphingobium sp. HII-3]